MRKSLVVAVLGLFVTGATAEPLKIIGFETGSGLAFEGATVSNYYTLEFAPTVAGPWTNWGSVSDQAITGAVMVLPSPFFYRIKQTDSSAFPPYVVGEETLRIVRGGVNANGTISKGSGFTVDHLTDGWYRINFTTPFADTPTIVAICYYFPATAYYQNARTNYCDIGTVIGGTSTDEGFNFIATGPR